MNVSQLEWIITLGVTIAVLLFDVIVIGRQPHAPTMRVRHRAVDLYRTGRAFRRVGLVLPRQPVRGGIRRRLAHRVQPVGGQPLHLPHHHGQLQCAEEYQQQALLVGIVLALIFRGIFIALGAVAINQFSWIFYIFGAFLVYTAVNLVRDTEHEDDGDNAVVGSRGAI